MPLTVLRNLVERAEGLGDYRSKLTGNDAAIARCEAAFEVYLEARSLIFDKARSTSETKGIQAGLKLSKPVLRSKQDELRLLIGENKLDAEVGKAQIQVIAAVAHGIQTEIDGKREEMFRYAGQVDGYAKLANDALEKIEAAIANHERQLRAAAEDDEDWSGRGTGNGQRSVKKKKTTRKKVVRKKATAKAN